MKLPDLRYFTYFAILQTIAQDKSWWNNTLRRNTKCTDYFVVLKNVSLYSDQRAIFLRSKPLSFEACRLILLDNSICNLLTYQDGVCSIYYNFSFTSSDLYKTLISTEINVGRISSDNCKSFDRKLMTAKTRFLKCTTNLKSNFSPAIFPSTPKLGIVISMTNSWAQTHKEAVSSITANFNCYAKIHNYSFILNIINDMTIGEFFYYRHKIVVSKYLPLYQHILHLDADSLVLNLSRSLDSYLSSPQHVHLHLHENGEITASAYLIRNSKYSRCFMRYWADWSPPHKEYSFNSKSYFNSFNTLNYDNGDLVAAMIELLDDTYARNCSISLDPPYASNNPYLDTVVQCLKPLLPNIHAYLARTAPLIRVYLPREGFWRTHSKRDRFSWWDPLLGSCYPSSDVIGHGWKAMARTMWNKSMQCDVNAARRGAGANPNCHWHNVSVERALVKYYCAWKSPACLVRQRRKDTLLADTENECLSVGSGCAAVRNHTTEQHTSFSVSSQSWLRNQMCSSCPPARSF